MLKWIRPGGAVVFVVLVAGIVLFWWLLADWLLKSGIESAGTKIMGAKVELADAKLSFSPLGFHLDKLQVTNPQQPMQNLVELDSATGNMELLPLLMGQVIVDEMSATGVRFHTARTHSGAIEKQPSKTETEQQAGEASGFNMGAVQEKLPSVQEILDKEPLTTLELTKTLESKIQSQRDELQQNVAALPDEQKIKQYEKRLQDITGPKIESLEDAQRREKQLEQVKDEIRADRDALRKARDQIRGAKDTVVDQYNALKQAPGDDWKRLKSRFGLDATGAGNITRLLFGEKAAIWLQRILSWSNQASRLLPKGGDSAEKTPEAIKPPRGEGRFIRFASSDPKPDFLVRKALLTLELQAGNIELSVLDATYQPHILGRPIRLHAAADKLQNADHIRFDGMIDHVNPDNAKDSVQWQISGWQLTDVVLSQEKSLPLTLSKARADFTGNLSLHADTLNADTKASFSNTQWSSSAQEGLAGRVTKTLSGIQRFNIDGKISGKLDSPDLSLRSDLDEQLRQAVAGELQKAQAELEQKLKARLNTEIEQAAGPYKEHLAFLDNTHGTVEQRINQLDEMLKTELKSAVDSKKQEAKDKVKDQLKGLKF